jgi:hypothetical protein
MIFDGQHMLLPSHRCQIVHIVKNVNKPYQKPRLFQNFKFDFRIFGLRVFSWKSWKNVGFPTFSVVLTARQTAFRSVYCQW